MEAEQMELSASIHLHECYQTNENSHGMAYLGKT